MNTEQVRFTMKVRNGSPTAATLTLEPWGDQTPLDVGGVVDLACSGPAGALIEVVVEPGGIVVYGWPGSVVEIVAPK
jgi:hypothetical protein